MHPFNPPLSHFSSEALIPSLQVLRHIEDLPFSPVHINPKSGVHPSLHPIFPPLSHNYYAAFIPSLHVLKHIEGSPFSPIHV